LPEQEEDTTLVLQFFLLNCEVVLEPTLYIVLDEG
jgi:hypothetical protein